MSGSKPGRVLPRVPPQVRFAKYVAPVGDCLVWTGALDRRGYGHLTVGRKSLAAHRLSWEWSQGPVPEGLELDHLCRNPACVRVIRGGMIEGDWWSAGGSDPLPSGSQALRGPTSRPTGRRSDGRVMCWQRPPPAVLFIPLTAAGILLDLGASRSRVASRERPAGLRIGSSRGSANPLHQRSRVHPGEHPVVRSE